MSKEYASFVPADQNAYKHYDWLYGFDINIDEPDSATQYVGYAKPGTLDADAKWLIMKISQVGNITKKRFANDDCKSFNCIWNDRATYF